MKTKEQIQKLIEEKQKELDQLKQELQTAKSPKVAWREEHELILENNGILSKWESWFESKESMEFVHCQFILMRELQIFAKLRNGDWEADWGDKGQNKVGIEFRVGEWCLENYLQRNPFVYGISFKSWEIAQEALEIFGQRIEQYYGK